MSYFWTFKEILEAAEKYWRNETDSLEQYVASLKEHEELSRLRPSGMPGLEGEVLFKAQVMTGNPPPDVLERLAKISAARRVVPGESIEYMVTKKAELIRLYRALKREDLALIELMQWKEDQTIARNAPDPQDKNKIMGKGKAEVDASCSVLIPFIEGLLVAQHKHDFAGAAALFRIGAQAEATALKQGLQLADITNAEGYIRRAADDLAEAKAVFASWEKNGVPLTVEEAKICVYCNRLNAKNACSVCFSRYCDAICQKRHWKTHKRVCVTKK